MAGSLRNSGLSIAEEPQMGANPKAIFSVSTTWSQPESSNDTKAVIDRLKGSLRVDAMAEELISRARENRLVTRTRFAVVQVSAPWLDINAVVEYSMLSGFAGQSGLKPPTITDGLAALEKFTEFHAQETAVICHSAVRMKARDAVKRKYLLIFSSLRGKSSLDVIALGNLPLRCRYLYMRP